MKNTALFYALVAVGILAVIAGVIMHIGIGAHHWNGKAYAVMVAGAIFLIAGVVGMFMGRSSSSSVASSK
ncbi:MAG TPA: hypothetical protein VKV40_09920 [Ktedonobacteraceae bacterium]|nr:hypothetical protein [Ktedonobacteraceae bacterium]